MDEHYFRSPQWFVDHVRGTTVVTGMGRIFLPVNMQIDTAQQGLDATVVINGMKGEMLH